MVLLLEYYLLSANLNAKQITLLILLVSGVVAIYVLLRLCCGLADAPQRLQRVEFSRFNYKVIFEFFNQRLHDIWQLFF